MTRDQGTLTFKEGEVSVRLTSLYLLVRNQLFQEELKIIFFHFQNNLILTSKDEEVSHTDTSPFRIKVSVPWLLSYYALLLIAAATDHFERT